MRKPAEHKVEDITLQHFKEPEEDKKKEVKFALEDEWNKTNADNTAEPSEPLGEEAEPAEPAQMEQSEEEDIQKIIQERDDYLSHLKRLQAEFDNFRKRVQKERIDLREYLLQEILSRLLDVADNMDRALHPHNKTDDIESYHAGVQMVYNQLMSVLGDYGLSRIECVGEQFDPQYHEAIAQQPSKEHEPGTILNEISPGYLLKDRVLRAPKVQVAVEASSESEEKSE